MKTLIVKSSAAQKDEAYFEFFPDGRYRQGWRPQLTNLQWKIENDRLLCNSTDDGNGWHPFFGNPFDDGRIWVENELRMAIETWLVESTLLGDQELPTVSLNF